MNVGLRQWPHNGKSTEVCHTLDWRNCTNVPKGNKGDIQHGSANTRKMSENTIMQFSKPVRESISPTANPPKDVQRKHLDDATFEANLKHAKKWKQPKPHQWAMGTIKFEIKQNSRFRCVVVHVCDQGRRGRTETINTSDGYTYGGTWTLCGIAPWWGWAEEREGVRI